MSSLENSQTSTVHECDVSTDTSRKSTSTYGFVRENIISPSSSSSSSNSAAAAISSKELRKFLNALEFQVYSKEKFNKVLLAVGHA